MNPVPLPLSYHLIGITNDRAHDWHSFSDAGSTKRLSPNDFARLTVPRIIARHQSLPDRESPASNPLFPAAVYILLHQFPPNQPMVIPRT